MKCTICGKEHTGGVTITLLDATWYYCSSICAFKSGHSDQVKEAMINFFATKHEDAKNTEPDHIIDTTKKEEINEKRLQRIERS